MKKIILTAVMAFTLLYVGLIDFSYAEDLAKDISELTGVEIAEENVPMILAQPANKDWRDIYGTKKVEEEMKKKEEE